jgi:hypothetical protein
MVVEGEGQVPDHAQAEFGNTMATVGEDPTEVRSQGKAGESPAKGQFAGNGRCKPD